MIMVPAQNIFKHQEQQQKNQCLSDGYVGFGDSFTENVDVISSRTSSPPWYDYHGRGGGETCLGFDHHRMAAEDESRSTSCENESGSNSRGTTSPTKDQKKDIDSCWLQLGLGGSETKFDPPTTTIEPTTSQTSRNLIELNLFSGANTTEHVMKPLTNTPNLCSHNTTSIISTPSTLFLQHPRTSYNFLHQHEVSWGYKPNPWNPTPSTSISSSSLLPNPPTMSMYYPHQLYQTPVLDIVGPSNSEFKVIDPPRRPHSGVWVILQASKNQEKEPFLPQIPKNYLRIKDGRTTVRLLTKYLVNKLRLNSESEIVIRCRGEELVPCLTLQHVRDNIWITSSTASRLCKRSSSSSSESDHHLLHPSMVTLLPNSSPTDHVMILHYARVGENTP